MKPRRVKGLDPDQSFAAAARAIVAVRARELEALAPPALEEGARRAQHDLRIAAKRLRYVLELAEPALGPHAARGAKDAKRLQEVLGELHDCDVMLPRVRSHAKRLRAHDAQALLAAAPAGARDLGPEAAREAPNRARHRGIETLRSYLVARRAVLFRRFEREWLALAQRPFGDALLASLSEPGPAPPAPRDEAR